MAIAKFVNGIDELHGALDSVKEGKRRRARLVCRWRPQGPQSYAPDGSKCYKHFYGWMYTEIYRGMRGNR